VIEVAAAIIHNVQGQVLIARRCPGKSQEGLWEFPGGKIEPGESIRQCLQRELVEEMGITILPYEAFGTNEHSYGSTHIKLIAWKAEYQGGEIKLVDHDACQWVLPEELVNYMFAPADIPFVERLLMESRKSAYHKLVRDRIPEIIITQGKTCRTRILDSGEYVTELRTKLYEETAEYLKADSDGQALEELADMLEVIFALAEIHGSDAGALEKIRAAKADQRGGFKDRVFLLDVEN
jgi:8-oxo-dGTP diphosphatase